MRKYFVWFALAAIAAAPQFARAAHGRAAYIDPTALGQQVQAKVADGALVVSRRSTAMVYETQTRTEARTRIVVVDGESREETFTVEVPVTVTKPVSSVIEHRVALKHLQAFDMQGKRVDDDQLTDALEEGRTILLATRKVPRYYLTIYKVDTLLVVVDPQDLYAAPPAPGVAPLLPTTTVVPPKVDAPRVLPPPGVPARADAPLKPAAAPKADATPAAPGGAALLAAATSMEPQVSIARIVDDKIGLRRYVKDITNETAYREVEKDGVKELVPVAVEVESITDVERKYPRDLLKIYRADKKPLTDDELDKLKDTERCVLVAVDAKDVDPKYLQIVKPETLIVVAPMAPQPHLSAPIIAPGPLSPPAPIPPQP